MRVLLRADAGDAQGTGHVMRCLTLAEELTSRGHSVQLMTGALPTGWLHDAVHEAGVEVFRCEFDTMPSETILAMRPDWVVVDSYKIPPAEISAVNAHVPVLAIIDGSDRGIDAALYLDQNLGAESRVPPAHSSSRLLGGPRFALIRDAVLDARREQPWKLPGHPPRVLSFMGGTDPTMASMGVAEALANLGGHFSLTMVAPREQHAALAAALNSRQDTTLLEPTRQLPSLFSEADLIISAAGTSAWDICTLGIPAVLIAVVDNQRASLREAVSRGLVLGLDITQDRDAFPDKLGACVVPLLVDEPLRRQLFDKSSTTFDGKGKVRVVSVMEERGGDR